MKKLIIKMRLIFVILLVLLFIPSFQNFSQNAFASEEFCIWEISETSKIPQNNLLEHQINESSIFFKLSSDFLSNPIYCNFSQKNDLRNQLILLDFLVESDQNYSMNLSLIDSDGNSVSSRSISDWYGVTPYKTAHIAIHYTDFEKINQFNLDDLVKIKLDLSENVKSITLSNIRLQTIQDYDTFSEYDNLPIQSIFPGFFLLLLISFPSGFILVYFTKFLKNYNFFVRLPWIFCFGFFSYIAIIYFTGLFQLTIETVLFYVIIEYVLFTIFLFKQQLLKFKIPSFTSSGIFFVCILIFSAIISTSLIGFTGWPMSANDGQGHVIHTSLTMYHNQVWDGTSFYPIRDIPPEFVKSWAFYPKGFHAASAGVGFLSNTFPGVAISTTFSFMMFLIPVLLSSIVFRFSNSIFLSSLMFLFIFWRPGDPSMPAMFGDLFWDNWLIGLLSNEVGILAVITSFMVFIEIFHKNSNQIRLILLLSLVFITIIISYYSFFALIILVGLFCVIPFSVHNKKKLVFLLASLVSFVGLYPIWSSFILNLLSNKIGIVVQNITPHWKYLTIQPFEPSGPLFPLWISVIISLIGSCFLIRIEKYRTLSIIVIVISTIQILAINEYLYLEHFSFNGNLRSLSLMFYFSIILNLIFFQKIYHQLREKNYFTFIHKKREKYLKILSILLVFVLLIPSGIQFGYDVNNINRIVKVPGGNEKNLLLWLYDNTDRSDLILNDHSHQSFYYAGFRAQNMINMNYDNSMISNSFDPDSKTFKPEYESGKSTVKANFILKNPWDYEYISETLNELDIKYVYISERKNIHQKCGIGPDSCYPDSSKWNWKQYSGESRIVMYENHPNLELVIRNGNSAVFRVI